MQQFGYDSLSRLDSVRVGAAAALPDLSALAAPSAPVPDPVPDRQPDVDALIEDAANPAANYTYDAVGNRLSAHTSSGAHVYQPTDLDQYAAVDGRPRVHDPNGNRIDDDGFAYGYDYRNQLVELRDKTSNGYTH
jgi:hypothetical protein